MDEHKNSNKFLKHKIGIIGGTFDPIHYGHLFIAETALDKLNLDKIIFIPAGIPPHKNQSLITDSFKRVDMVKLATKKNSNFEVSTIEVNKQKTSYTIDTIKELKKYYNNKVDIFFITGDDAFINIETWKKYDELLNSTNFIVMTRSINNSKLLNEKIELYKTKYNANVTKVEIPILEISSTDVRERIKKNNSIKYLLPEEVEKYILENKLYMEQGL